MNKNKGYSLIEVLMAMTIILIGILPIMSMYPVIFKTNFTADSTEETSRMAYTIIDYIKAKGYSYYDVSNGGLLNSAQKGNPFSYSNKKLDPIEGTINVFGSKDFEGVGFLNHSSSDLFLVSGKTKHTPIISITMEQTSLKLTNTSSYTNIIGTTDLLESSMIYGVVTVELEGSGSNGKPDKSFTAKFIITPLEDW